jgi:perosamine synthetase
MIPWASPHYWGNEREYLLQAFDSSWISGGPFVEHLENEFARKCGSKFAIAVSNGTSALHLAFLGLNLSPKDEVIVPGFAFQAAANVAINTGLVPVFAEVNQKTWCIDPESIPDKITNRTRAIVVVHSYGNSCQMNEISSLAENKGLFLIEDAAEALGTKYNNKWLGTIGKIGSFSLHATKTVSTGEGGLVITDDESLYRLMKLYRSHGMNKKRYWHDVAGHNFRMTNLQAAIGCGQLECIGKIFRERKMIYSRYHKALSGQTGITTQLFPQEVDAVPWTFACMLDDKVFGQRDEVMEKMYAIGIETRPGFYPASLQPIYDCPPLKICENVASKTISLPGSPPNDNLDVETICSSLLSMRR